MVDQSTIERVTHEERRKLLAEPYVILNNEVPTHFLFTFPSK